MRTSSWSADMRGHGCLAIEFDQERRRGLGNGRSETHQVLLLNGLRNRVTLRTDGGMRSGEDIVCATLLGAEEYNFGTAALIARVGLCPPMPP